MTYKLTNINLELITSPIILIMPTNADAADSQQNLFRDGLELAEKKFNQRYDINTVRAREDGIIEISLTLPEVERARTATNKAVDTVGTADTVSFF